MPSVNVAKTTPCWWKILWKTCEFVSDYAYKAEKLENGLLVKIKANSFAKGVTLRLPENCKYLYSDNYFDMQAGEEKTVYVYGEEISAEQLEVTDFVKEKAHA